MTGGADDKPDIVSCRNGIVESVRNGDRVLRILRLAGAEAVGREKRFGSVEPGEDELHHGG